LILFVFFSDISCQGEYGRENKLFRTWNESPVACTQDQYTQLNTAVMNFPERNNIRKKTTTWYVLFVNQNWGREDGV
jgi:protein associated with RNAse G/E